MHFQYYLPTRIFFGKGELNRLSTERLPGKKALLVTSAGQSMRAFGYLDRVISLLDKNGVQVVLFDKILPNPVKSHVMEGASLARKEGCDFVVGLGGGSSIDSAKSIAIMAANDGDYWDYIDGGSGKGRPVSCTPLPVVAVTTTAGTGTEADPFTVITKEETGEKVGFGIDGTFPVLSIVDPDLMRSVPSRLTAYQGFDALFHSTEGYIARCANVMSDLYALKAIELIGAYLPRAVRGGGDEEARAMVALANTLSGMVESLSSCISEHSLEHALSGRHPDLPHGAGLIMVSLQYYETFLGHAEERYIAMARALGYRDADKAADFLEALRRLQVECGVEKLRMSDYGIERNELPELARHAKETMGGLFALDPRELSLPEIIGILEKSYC